MRTVKILEHRGKYGTISWRVFINQRLGNGYYRIVFSRFIQHYEQALAFGECVAKHEQIELIVQDRFGVVTSKHKYGEA